MHRNEGDNFGDCSPFASCLNSSLHAPDIVDGDYCLGVLSDLRQQSFGIYVWRYAEKSNYQASKRQSGAAPTLVASS